MKYFIVAVFPELISPTIIVGRLTFITNKYFILYPIIIFKNYYLEQKLLNNLINFHNFESIEEN